jgi:TonB-dependent SusC/RagA subfamily outer membrane receptor
VNAAKLAEEMQIKTASDFLVGRVPGVTVLPANQTGMGTQIRIRGSSTLGAANINRPMWIIDGVRILDGGGGTFGGSSSASYLDQFSPGEIEDIQVVKGPSAATLYGTDAANGVIVVTTKRGQVGRPQWSWTAEHAIIDDRNDYPNQYAILGHTTASPAARSVRCSLQTLAAGTCIQDSLSVTNLLMDSETTPIATGHRNRLSTQVSGGTPDLRYFLSAEFMDETGPVRMPGFAQDYFSDLNIIRRESALRPSFLEQKSIRGNFSVALGAKMDVSLGASIVRRHQRSPVTDGVTQGWVYQALAGPGCEGACPGYTGVGTLGEPLNGYFQTTPGYVFQRLNESSPDRFLGNVNAHWRPTTWLTSETSIGYDLSTIHIHQLCRLNECANFGTLRQGFVQQQQVAGALFTARWNGNAIWKAKPGLTFTTTGGLDYFTASIYHTVAIGEGLAPGATTANAATTRTLSQEQPTAPLGKTLGMYIQEQAAFNDRLFLTLALRSDRNSGFGEDFPNAYYPKASVSWIATEEPFFPQISWLNSLRLRSAWGESGLQPGATANLRTYTAATVSIDGVDVPGLTLNQPGNAASEPQVVREWEAGFEAHMLRNRLNLDVTWYDKRARNANLSVPLAPSVATPQSNLLVNRAAIKNTGIEVGVTGQILDYPQFGWEMNVNGSKNNQKVLSLGRDEAGNPNPAQNSGCLTNSLCRNVVGYPVRGHWARPYTYDDANNDGLISASEVTISPDTVYIGPLQPAQQYSITNSFRLLGNALRLNVLVDGRNDFGLLNQTDEALCRTRPSHNDNSNPNASLRAQARCVAATAPTPTSYGYVEKVHYWKLREINANYTVPARFARLARLDGLTVNLAVSNIHTWTNFTGIDPEANTAIMSDIQQSLYTVGAPTYYTLRFNFRH